MPQDPLTFIFADASSVIKRLAIKSPNAGANVLIPPVVGKSIRVLSLNIMPVQHGNIRFISYTNPANRTDLTGPMLMPEGTMFEFTFSPVGHFETIQGEGLAVFLDGDGLPVEIHGVLTYILV